MSGQFIVTNDLQDLIKVELFENVVPSNLNEKLVKLLNDLTELASKECIDYLTAFL